MRKQITSQNVTRARGGFTLLELLIVLAIIVVIAAMVVPNLLGQRDTALIRSSKAAILSVETSLKFYNVDFGSYKEGGNEVLTELSTVMDVDGQKKVYLETPALDSWDRPLNYEWPNTKMQDAIKPAIWSNGPNGTNDNGEGDDINNWTVKDPNAS